MPPTPAPGLVKANLLCMASMIIWAAGLPASQPLIEILPPLALTAARMGLAALVLLPLWIAADGMGALRQARWGRGLLIGGSTIGLGAVCLVIGQSLSDPVTVAIISAGMPVVGMAIEVILDGRRVTPALMIGLALGLIGALVAIDLTGARPGFGWGALLCLVSVLTFTIGSRWTVTALPGLSPIGGTTVTIAGAAVATGLAAIFQQLVTGHPAPWALLTGWNWAALVFYALCSMALSQVLWIGSVGRLGIGLAALHINATPFYVMLILFAFGDPWLWHQALGALIVGIGVLAAQNLLWPRRA